MERERDKVIEWIFVCFHPNSVSILYSHTFRLILNSIAIIILIFFSSFSNRYYQARHSWLHLSHLSTFFFIFLISLPFSFSFSFLQRLVQLVIGWKKQQKLIYRLQPLVTLYQLWSMVNHHIFLTEIPNWPDCYRFVSIFNR